MSTSSKTIVLISSDGEKFTVDLDTVANESVMVKTIFEVDEANSFGDNIDQIYEVPLPLYDVPSNILSKVIDYCKKHSDKTLSNDDLKAFDSEFIKVDNHTLFGLIVAAVYLYIKSLLDLTCLVVIDMINDMSPEEIYKTLDIKNDFTPNEVECLYGRNSWAFHEIKLKKETESKLSTFEFAHLTDKEKRKMDKESFMKRVLPAASPTKFAYLAPEEKREWVLVAALIPQMRVRSEAAASRMQSSRLQTDIAYLYVYFYAIFGRFRI